MDSISFPHIYISPHLSHKNHIDISNPFLFGACSLTPIHYLWANTQTSPFALAQNDHPKSVLALKCTLSKDSEAYLFHLWASVSTNFMQSDRDTSRPHPFGLLSLVQLADAFGVCWPKSARKCRICYIGRYVFC